MFRNMHEAEEEMISLLKEEQSERKRTASEKKEAIESLDRRIQEIDNQISRLIGDLLTPDQRTRLIARGLSPKRASVIRDLSAAYASLVDARRVYDSGTWGSPYRNKRES